MGGARNHGPPEFTGVPVAGGREWAVSGAALNAGLAVEAGWADGVPDERVSSGMLLVRCHASIMATRKRGR